MKKSLLFWMLLLISLFSFSVIAADESAFRLADIVKTIEGFNIGEAYNAAPYVIDGILYLILFIGIAQVTLGRRFEGRGGKAVITAIGLILAVSLSVWSMKTGFKLAKLGPLAGLIFVIIVAMFIFRLIRGERKAGAGVWMAILMIYISMYVFFYELIDTLNAAGKWGRLAVGLLNILGIIAIPMAIIGLFKLGRGEDEPGGRRYGGVPGLGGGTGDEEGTAEETRRRDRDIEAREAEITQNELNEVRDFYNKIKDLSGDLESDEAIPADDYNKRVDKLLTELDSIIDLEKKAIAYAKRLLKRKYKSFRLYRTRHRATEAGRRAPTFKSGAYVKRVKTALKKMEDENYIYHMVRDCERHLENSKKQTENKERKKHVKKARILIESAFKMLNNIFWVEKRDINL